MASALWAKFSISLQCAALLFGTDPNFPKVQGPFFQKGKVHQPLITYFINGYLIKKRGVRSHLFTNQSHQPDDIFGKPIALPNVSTAATHFLRDSPRGFWSQRTSNAPVR